LWWHNCWFRMRVRTPRKVALIRRFRAIPISIAATGPSFLPKLGLLFCSIAEGDELHFDISHFQGAFVNRPSQYRGSANQNDRAGNIGKDLGVSRSEGKEASRTTRSMSFESAADLQVA
jgi:hypothetical protein